MGKSVWVVTVLVDGTSFHNCWERTYYGRKTLCKMFLKQKTGKNLELGTMQTNVFKKREYKKKLIPMLAKVSKHQGN